MTEDEPVEQHPCDAPSTPVAAHRELEFVPATLELSGVVAGVVRATVHSDHHVHITVGGAGDAVDAHIQPTLADDTRTRVRLEWCEFGDADPQLVSARPLPSRVLTTQDDDDVAVVVVEALLWRWEVTSHDRTTDPFGRKGPRA